MSLVKAQSWSTVPKWADFGLYGPLCFKDLYFKLEFMMDNYEIISLEKCLNDNRNSQHVTLSMELYIILILSNTIVFQEQHFVNLTAKMRAIRPDSEAKILHYWAVMFSQLSCYEAANDLMANPDLWLKDDLGYPVYSDNRGNSYYDFRIEEAINIIGYNK